MIPVIIRSLAKFKPRNAYQLMLSDALDVPTNYDEDIFR